jgi:hypothetical protein
MSCSPLRVHVVFALARAALIRHREVGHAVVSEIEHKNMPDRQFLHHAAGALMLRDCHKIT